MYEHVAIAGVFFAILGAGIAVRSALGFFDAVAVAIAFIRIAWSVVKRKAKRLIRIGAYPVGAYIVCAGVIIAAVLGRAFTLATIAMISFGATVSIITGAGVGSSNAAAATTRIISAWIFIITGVAVIGWIGAEAVAGAVIISTIVAVAAILGGAYALAAIAMIF